MNNAKLSSNIITYIGNKSGNYKIQQQKGLRKYWVKNLKRKYCLKKENMELKKEVER